MRYSNFVPTFIYADIFDINEIEEVEKQIQEHFVILTQDDASYNVMQAIDLDQVRNNHIVQNVAHCVFTQWTLKWIWGQQ